MNSDKDKNFLNKTSDTNFSAVDNQNINPLTIGSSKFQINTKTSDITKDSFVKLCMLISENDLSKLPSEFDENLSPRIYYTDCLLPKGVKGKALAIKGSSVEDRCDTCLNVAKKLVSNLNTVKLNLLIPNCFDLSVFRLNYNDSSSVTFNQPVHSYFYYVISINCNIGFLKDFLMAIYNEIEDLSKKIDLKSYAIDPIDFSNKITVRLFLNIFY